MKIATPTTTELAAADRNARKSGRMGFTERWAIYLGDNLVADISAKAGADEASLLAQLVKDRVIPAGCTAKRA